MITAPCEAPYECARAAQWHEEDSCRARDSVVCVCGRRSSSCARAVTQLPRGSLCIGYSCGLTNLNVSYSLQHKISENDTSLII